MPRQIVSRQMVNAEQLRVARELRKHQTPEERILWNELRRNRLGAHFRRQQIIAGYIADFYCHSAGLAVELDGDVHQQQSGYDRMRDQSFARLGIRTLRFTNRNLRNDLHLVLAKIRAALT